MTDQITIDDALLDEIEEKAKEAVDGSPSTILALVAEVRKLREQNRRAAEALRPFANVAAIHELEPDSYIMVSGFGSVPLITVGRLRAARAWLKENEG